MFSNNFLFCMNNIQELKVLHHKSSHFKEHTVFSKGHQTLVMDGSSLKGFTWFLSGMSLLSLRPINVNNHVYILTTYIKSKWTPM